MIRTIIIDDDASVRSTLRRLLGEYCPDIEVIAEAGNFHDAVQSIYYCAPSLVFMDIQLMDCAGFEVLNVFPADAFAVIMMSAYEQYAVQAFDYDSKGYLLKPFNVEKLQSAVARVRAKLHLLDTEQKYTHIVEEHQQLSDTHHVTNNSVMVKSTKGTVNVNIADIVTCSMHYGYVRLMFRSQPMVLAMNTLAEWEKWLPEQMFMKIHRSHIINLHCVQQWEHDGKEAIARMSTGEILTVSRTNKPDFISYMEELVVK